MAVYVEIGGEKVNALDLEVLVNRYSPLVEHHLKEARGEYDDTHSEIRDLLAALKQMVATVCATRVKVQAMIIERESLGIVDGMLHQLAEELDGSIDAFAAEPEGDAPRIVMPS